MNSDSKNRINKWRTNALESNFWSTSGHQKIKSLEAQIISSYLTDLGIQKILELGSGDGVVGCRILNINRDIKTWVFSDLLEECIQVTKKNCHDKRATFKIIDAHDLNSFFKMSSIECIVSTGYASVASYKEVISPIAKILRPGGFLIADFINHLSIPLLPKFFHNLMQYRNRNNYHLGPIGIREHFQQYNLRLVNTTFVENIFSGPFISVFQKNEY